MNEKETKRYLGIDWGEKRIGLSLGDDLLKTATPAETVSTLKEVLKIAKTEAIDEIIIGLPRSLSGGDNRLMPGFSAFLMSLEKKSRLKTIRVDERFSSKAADALAGTKKEKAGRDSIAAMLILQSYLDRI